MAPGAGASHLGRTSGKWSRAEEAGRRQCPGVWGDPAGTPEPSPLPCQPDLCPLVVSAAPRPPGGRAPSGPRPREATLGSSRPTSACDARTTPALGPANPAPNATSLYRPNRAPCASLRLVPSGNTRSDPATCRRHSCYTPLNTAASDKAKRPRGETTHRDGRHVGVTESQAMGGVRGVLRRKPARTPERHPGNGGKIQAANPS